LYTLSAQHDPSPPEEGEHVNGHGDGYSRFEHVEMVPRAIDIVKLPDPAYCPHGHLSLRTVSMLIPEFSGKTIAIDFETATEARASACSIGLAFVEDGQVVRVEERLIRPPENRFSPFNIAIHGIRPEHTVNAPDFAEVLAEFASDFEGARMVAHNASFDFSVLRACLDLCGLDYPEVSYLCSVKLAQRHWPELGSHRLNVLAQHLGLTFAHHNAAEDARICAEACLAMRAEAGATDFFELALKLGVHAGRLSRRSYEPCSFTRKPRRATDLQA
jgi:DNA polymerase III subunit epsilon